MSHTFNQGDPRRPALQPLRRWMILIAVMLAFLPIVLDMTILHIAVPSMTLGLQASSTQVLWIIDIYSLLMAGLLVPMGTLADRIGNRKLLLTGLCVFTIASVAAAFSVTPAMLIAGRIFLAFGASMIMPCVLGIIRRTFADPGERALALGLWGTVGAAGAAVGPLVGGALLEHFWWGSVFLINVPVMLFILPIIVFALPKAETLTPGTWLFSHALLLIVGIIAVVFAIKSGFGGKQPLWLAGLSLLAGLAALTVFVRKQLAMRQPMLDLSLFARPAIRAGIAMALVASGALAGVELTLAQELQFVLDKTPLEAGLFMLPIMAAAALGGPIAGYLSNRFGLRAVASLSMLTSAICLGLLAQADFYDPGTMVPVLLGLLGLGLSIGLTASSIAIMGSVEAEKGGAAGALEGTGYELGAGLGITLFGIALSATYAASVVVPSGIAAEFAQQAAHSIGDTHVVAQMLGKEQAAELIAAGRAAFSGAHAFLLMAAAFLIGALAIAVFLVLKEPGRGGRPRLGGTATAVAVLDADGGSLKPAGYPYSILQTERRPQ